MLYPDLTLSGVEELTPEVLQQYGLRGIIFDLDETLAPYSAPAPLPQILEHILMLKQAGVVMALVSNSPRERVSSFNRDIQIPIFPKAKKPGTKALRRAVARMGFAPREIAMVGDQIFTDVLAGNRAGLFTVLIPPVQDRDTRFFRWKRRMEKLVLRRFHGA